MFKEQPRQHDIDSGVELLRCLLMFGVVLHHAIGFSPTVVGRPYLPLWLLTILAVDGFLVISGWYGVRFTWRKWLGIAGQIVFYGVLLSGVSVVLALLGLIATPRIGIGQAWYGVAYLGLMVFCPIINAGVAELGAKFSAWAVALPVAVVFMVDWLSRCIGLGFSINGFGSHTFATFIGLYALVRLLRKDIERRTRTTVFCGICAFVVYEVIFCLRGVVMNVASLLEIVGDWGFYNCPFIVLSAMALFLGFKSMKVSSIVARIAHFIAPSTFAVYLISDANAMVKDFFLHQIVPTCGMVGGSAVMFAMCVVLDVTVRRIPLRIAKFVGQRRWHE